LDVLVKANKRNPTKALKKLEGSNLIKRSLFSSMLHHVYYYRFLNNCISIIDKTT